jgi:LacI family transcriptional regulator
LKRVTIKEVAAEAAVSVATVSLVLNNKSSRISLETQHRVQQAAAKLGFVYNHYAQSLKMAQTKTIGLILPDISNHFFMRIAQEIERELVNAGYLLLLANTDGDAHKEIQALERFKHLKVAYIILVASHAQTYQFVDQAKLNHKVIFLDRSMGLDQHHCVRVDDWQGGYLAASELIAHGHTHVACITGPSHFINVQERLGGFRQAYQSCNLPYLLEELEGDFTLDSGYQLAQRVFTLEVSAVFLMNDLMAMGFYQACQQQGKEIPQHYSVIGYDDSVLAGYLHPPLTTVCQPITQISQYVVQHMLGQQLDTQKIPVSLHQRMSVARVSL